MKMKMKMKSLTLFFVFLLLLEALCCEGCLKEEREALSGLNSCLGHLLHWDVNIQKDCCEWEGVKCNSSTGRVAGLKIFMSDPIQQQYINCSDFSVFIDLKNLSFIAVPKLELFPNNNQLDNFNKHSSFHVFETLSSKLPNLEVLYISGIYLTNHILPSLKGFTSLKILSLRDTGLDSDLDIEALCSKLRNLEVLDLSYNNFNHTDIGSALSGLSSLKSLYLENS